MDNYIMTSESVTSGHPDKICDLIADSILDEALHQDPRSHMAVEASIKDDLILIFGEASTSAVIDYESIAKRVMQEIGYPEEYHVIIKVTTQSPEITAAVSHTDLSAGDQGIMFGYACDETPNFMPYAIDCAHRLAKRLEEVRRTDDRLLPDGKTQVSAEYKDGRVVRIAAIVVSAQHRAGVSHEELEDLICREVIAPIIDPSLLDEQTKILINPSGSFVLGGSWGDSGTTGRKIVVDSYGGYAPIGGGCFSSKDPTKVDRSAAYYARYVCRNLVEQGLCRKCMLQLSYAIGEPEPVSVYLDTFGTGILPDDALLEIVNRNFSFRVADMINELDLFRPIYAETTNYGHFGREGFPWETTKKLVLD